MKKFFWFLGIAALAFSVVACDKDEKKPDVNNITEDGFYVVGEATGMSTVTKELTMAVGINEAAKQTQRAGMYEKYIVLEGGKDFTLAYVKGGEQIAYGATLAEFTPELGDDGKPVGTIYEENPATGVFKGSLVIGDAAPKMKVSATGLYHIVLDLNEDGVLADAQIVLCPVTLGVRGGMNSWGFTALEATAASNAGITYTLSGQELASGGEFKFAYNNAWKITLDAEGKVKANTNLGKDCKPGGDNIAVTEGAGVYKITLTYKLAEGDIANSFNYEIVQESASAAPEHMYMIGAQFGSWSWDSDGVAELVPVWGTTGKFWCTRWFDKDQGFKFCSVKAWNGDFTGAGTVGYSVADGNCWVPETGFYTVFVDGNEGVVEIAPAKVFGFGDAVFTGGWDFDSAEEFVAEGDKMVITTSGAGELRMASKVVPTVADNQCTPNGWYDWWKTEFVFYEDGKIVYRAGGDDQARFNVEGGKKISLDFNAGTATIEDAVAPAIVIDGDLSDWDAIEGVTGESVSAAFKATSDSKNIYLYYKRTTERMADLWDGNGYVYLCFDTDNDPATGVELWGNGPYEMVLVAYPYAESGHITVAKAGAVAPESCSVAAMACAGAVTEDGVAVEFSIPRADLLAIPAEQITLWAWSNKGGTKLELHCTL